jgi:CubicO group peptidase (beta-lactamase class C family)
MSPASRFDLSRREFGRLLVAGSVGAALSPGWVGSARADGRTRASDGLARSAPHEQGVDAASIQGFLDEVAAAGLELHSFMLYRHGHVIAEGWWWPYRADRLHMMHSLTKSVAVSGVALAMGEGHFGLDDKVVSFFKDELPAKVDDKLAAMTVKDLLTMRTGHAAETSGSVWRQITTSWVAEFFKIPVVYPPGTKFVYTSAASFMLSAIVTQTTGQKLRDYMQPRFFKPLGITNLRWDVGPGGINPGGNGLTWTTADVLKLGALYAQGGLWEGKRILSADWVRAASTPQVAEGEYGYQWWIGPNKAFYALGLFTQMSIVFPEHDAVLAVTSAIDGSKNLLPIVWKHFPSAFGAGTSSAGQASESKLRERTASLRLLPPFVTSKSPTSARISGRTFNIESNEDEVASVRFDFGADRCEFVLRDARGEHKVTNGLKDWAEGTTSMTGNRLHHEYQLDDMRVVAGGRWLDDNTFEMTWQFVESAFRDRVLCRFEGNRMTLDRSVNVNSAATSRPQIRGMM